MENNQSAAKTDYRIRLVEANPGSTPSPKHEYNMPCNSPENLNSESDTKTSVKATNISGPGSKSSSSKRISMATPRSKIRSHGDARRHFAPSSPSGAQHDKLKPRSPRDYFDLQMAYKGFRTQEERNFFAYSRVMIQNRFQAIGSNRVQSVGFTKYDPSMMAVVNISKPMRLESRYSIKPQLECE